MTIRSVLHIVSEQKIILLMKKTNLSYCHDP